MLALLLAWVTLTQDTMTARSQAAQHDSQSRLALQRALQAFSAAFLRADTETLDTFLVAGLVDT